MSIQLAPFGSWKSPITSASIVAGSIGLGQVLVDGANVYWVESRPTEKGRSVIVNLKSDGQITDITPPPLNARTRVHEYGGGSFTAHHGTVFFANFADQQLYRVAPDSDPLQITSYPAMRYGDLIMDQQRHRLICVCEDHSDASREAVNTLVTIQLAGSGAVELLEGGHDFYSSPRLSPNGSQIAWITWDHPNMPWDGSQLWLAEIDEHGALTNKRLIAGGARESIFQPEWSPVGHLHFVSDRTGWWNLYRWRQEQIEPLCPMEAEFGVPQWGLGMSTYGFASNELIVCTYLEHGYTRLALLDTRTGWLERIDVPFTQMEGIRVAGGKAIFTAGAPLELTTIVSFDSSTRRLETLQQSSDLTIDPGYFSAVQAVEFPTADGLTAHGFFYPPANRDYAAPEGQRPPLIVKIHGGPTAAASATLKLGIQYWTSRGIAVLDVNYGGSTGYGRAYRERLNGNWGVTDVADCVNGARYLAERGLVDGNRMAITGGSAGGYTVLCALTSSNVFKAGASHYGVADLEALEVDTHKFESRYTHGLVAPYPERADLYRERSPIHHIDKLSAPVIFFQGLEDKIVPPNQAEMMVDALRSKGLPVAYVAFEGEQHGFRQAANIKRALDGELYFYSRVFGFDLAEEVETVRIENLR